MTRLQLRYHPEVIRKDIPRLDPPTRKRIRTAIEQKLMARPEEFAKPLAYTRAGLWSLRVGPWRVIFALRENDLWILRIGHRREVYEALDREVPDAD
jgi:mRNA interferase RelE/StbE